MSDREIPEGEGAGAARPERDAPPRILVDGHGGDHGPATVVDALGIALSGRGAGRHALGVVGLPDVLGPELTRAGLDEKVALVPATEVVGMDDSPAAALRRKRGSSIHVGARKVREGEWDAFVSSGNTGALMAISKLALKTLPGIDRPAIASMIPGIDGSTLFLDVGANVDCTSEHLVQFAFMGSCYMRAAEGIDAPRVGLLNIGSEEIKGTDVIKLTSSMLAETDLNFIGNVEGTDIFSDRVDVVVCDGFVGNVALKSMEGTARFIIHHLKRELRSSLTARLGALLARPALKRFANDLHPSEYNGAPLLGLNGVVVKSHGSADARGIASAVEVARREVAADLDGEIVAALAAWQGLEEA